jgi:hypothetical protein
MKLLALLLAMAACDEKDGGIKSYNFSANASQRLKSTSVLSLTSTAGLYKDDGLCTSVICLTPDSATGKYFGAGLLIQSSGKGMSSYFDHESWSSVTTASATKDFDLAAPLTHSGTLYCCGGEGDLSSENTYFSDTSYMFQYLDIGFTIPASLGMRGTAVGTHNIRFILADDAVASAKRGDLMVWDSSQYKWMDQDGNLSAIRPSSPVTMNEKVVDWQSPFGDGKGNTEIPVIYAGLKEPSNGKQVTSEDELKKSATYTFDFNAAGMIMFPDLLHADGAMIGDLKSLLGKIHLRGLEYGSRGVLELGTTTLTIE